jgi:hypothetical protein
VRHIPSTRKTSHSRQRRRLPDSQSKDDSDILDGKVPPTQKWMSSSLSDQTALSKLNMPSSADSACDKSVAVAQCPVRCKRPVCPSHLSAVIERAAFPLQRRLAACFM